MADDTAYPSEILDAGASEKSLDRPTSAWVRFFARMVDYGWIYLLLYVLRRYFLGIPHYFFYYFPVEYALFIPIEALFLWCKQATPGKMLLSIRVQHTQGDFSFSRCLRRACKVYFRGVGMGVFLVHFFCLSFSYSRFVQTGRAVWDAEEHFEVHHKVPQTTNILLGIFLFFFFFFFKRYA